MKFSDFSKRLAEDTKANLRDKFITGKLFNVGDIVETNDGVVAEVINRGANYVTLICEGKSFKKWITEIKASDAEFDSEFKIILEQVSVKGKKTHNFDSGVSEFFKALYESTDDKYAVLNFMESLDFILGATPFKVKHQLNKYMIEYNKLEKYFTRFGVDPSCVSVKRQIIDDIKVQNDR